MFNPKSLSSALTFATLSAITLPITLFLLVEGARSGPWWFFLLVLATIAVQAANIAVPFIYWNDLTDE